MTSENTVRPGRNPVDSRQLFSGAKVEREKPSEKVVESAVREVAKAKEEITKISDSAAANVDIIAQNRSASEATVQDLDRAIELADNLKFNIPVKKEEALDSHQIDPGRVQEFLS